MKESQAGALTFIIVFALILALTVVVVGRCSGDTGEAIKVTPFPTPIPMQGLDKEDFDAILFETPTPQPITITTTTQAPGVIINVTFIESD